MFPFQAFDFLSLTKKYTFILGMGSTIARTVKMLTDNQRGDERELSIVGSKAIVGK